MNKIHFELLRGFTVLLSLFFFSLGQASNPIGQTLQISTHLKILYGTPSWLLIIRNVQTGKVSPYLFDIRKEDNYWVALAQGYSYRVTASTLTWGPFAKIHNFCHLENGIIRGKSMWITIQGALSPDSRSFTCKVIKYND